MKTAYRVGGSIPARKEVGLETARPEYVAERILDRFRDLGNNPEEVITPYKEFWVDGDLYYFTPGGFLYRRDPATEELGGVFCGYLTDEVWHYRTDDS